MPTSDARIRANQQNALRSTGPRTPEGKERSRQNGLKHGLTGSGLVVAEQYAAEIATRHEALETEFAPKSSLGQVMVQKMATLSIRMERAANQECAAIARNVRHASENFDHARIDAAEELFDSIADNPRKNLRMLRRSPEGVERLIEAWGDLREILTQSDRPNWTPAHLSMVAHLIGKRGDQLQGSRLDALGRAVRGESVEFAESGWAGWGEQERRSWAVARLVERIDAEIAGLETHYETLDFELIELDRAGAADVALFDPSREANLARRYESEARRGFFRALKEFRLAEAEAAARPAPKPIPRPEPAVVAEPLASSCAGGSRTPREPEPVDQEWSSDPVSMRNGAARGLDGRVIAVGRAVVAAG